jgi:DNA modification methylase
MQQSLLTDNSGFEEGRPVQDTSQWGTFRDSLRAPLHSWFTYPAGFSYKAVEHSIKEAGLKSGKDTIYDPFMGSGTTNIVAKQMGLNSVGVEAHPFVYDITLTKMYWELNVDEISNFLDKTRPLVNKLPAEEVAQESNQDAFPELVIKCFLPTSLYVLREIRDSVKNSKILSLESKRFLNTALICTLRDVSIAATGWPYIAPRKIKVTSMSKNAVETYLRRVYKMLEDIRIAKAITKTTSKHRLVLGSSNKTTLKKESMDHIFTSPPYLNNFDYADRTRLEMYFMGNAASWGDISTKIRTKLMTSATTQISRTDPKYILNKDIKSTSPEVYDFLEKSKDELGELRKIKGGKKSYDLLVSGYFNDMYEILKDNFRVLKSGSKALYILGDSAPYGVHIPTDELIGKLGTGVGFKSYDIEVLRTRGGKWAANPQRHTVPLRETIVTLRK